MQVFVWPADLTNLTGTVRVAGAFDDGTSIDRSWSEGLTRLSLPSSVLENTITGMQLQSGWREANKRQLLGGEATHRIDDVFPEYSQLNANAEMNEYIRDHGSDMAQWPAAANSRATEIDRCWKYVNAVREAVGRLMNMAVPANPGADAHWPSRIQPFQTR
jgi:hypothetical protein